MIVIDMDMPKSCRECPLRQRSEKYMGENYCMGMLGKPIKSDIFTKRADFCPIKCDIEDIKTEIEQFKSNEHTCEYGGFDRAYNGIMEIINKHTKGDKE